MILHVDMDAYYASVEEREQPDLRGQPVIVGGSPQGRGVVAAANYEARQFGIHSAMPTARALQLCPHLVVVKPRMELYAQIAREIRAIFHRFTPLVEPLSLDEAFLDVGGCQAISGSPVETGQQIKAAIAAELQLVASVGVAPNKFLAKIASDLEKPDGFVVVKPDNVHAFLDPLSISRLWGVGRVTEKAFKRQGLKTIGDVRRLPLATMQQLFGSQGEHFWNLANGIDNRQVTPDRQAKSISHETTFPEDIEDLEALQTWAVELSSQVARRLRSRSLEGNTVHLKARSSDFRTIVRSKKLRDPSNATQEISRIARQLLTQSVPRSHLPLRLLGVGVSGLKPAADRQLLLFDETDEAPQTGIDDASDKILAKFGDAALIRASNLLHNARHTPQPRPDKSPDGDI